MNQFPYPFKRIGIIGGGQLAQMSAQVAKTMGFYVTILDSSTQCPASDIADAQIIGSLYDSEKLRALADVSDVLTYDIEHIDIKTLQELDNEGHAIFPSPKVLEIIQDKLKQKQLFEQHNIPTAKFEQVDKLTSEHLAKLPIVQKARMGGYDGKGVVVLKDNLADALQTPSIIEELIDFDKELAIIIARGIDGITACYPVVEMVFDSKTNICDIVAAPAKISSEIEQQARKIALQAIEALDGVGIFGVEMFLTHDGQVLINEIAPRPHNSGHYTMEACVTSQFEQLIRIISYLPLGNTDLLKPAVMLNLLGEAGHNGQPILVGLPEALAISGLTLHWYDKETTRPFRKMGHITVLDDNLDAAITKVELAKNILTIKGKETI
ncbi:MAG: 5-(carboxyamino)imidazole ribonucleotide synthase [Proteobacteria bacterium]|nr:5-(carboxyamino)imidazole ribonucleotide synthase [Pseudomonadota bacterium]